MGFWDRFVRAMWFGLAADPGNDGGAAVRTVDRAFARGRLRPPDLDDVSLYQLSALLPAGSSHGPAVLAVARARGLHLRTDAPDRLRAAAPPRLDDFLELGRHGTSFRPLIQIALRQPVAVELLEAASLFYGRMWLTEPAGPPNWPGMSGLLDEAVRRYLRIPAGTYDFSAYLFRRVRWYSHLVGVAFPCLIPPGPPPGLADLGADERQFLDAVSLDLDQRSQEVLYLHFYGRLTARQIVATFWLERPRQQGLVEAVVRRLEAAWEVVL